MEADEAGRDQSPAQGRGSELSVEMSSAGMTERQSLAGQGVINPSE